MENDEIKDSINIEQRDITRGSLSLGIRVIKVRFQSSLVYTYRNVAAISTCELPKLRLPHGLATAFISFTYMAIRQSASLQRTSCRSSFSSVPLRLLRLLAGPQML
jgi:hypothetical protein